MRLIAMMLEKYSALSKNGLNIQEYMMSIHPTSWSQFGNFDENFTGWSGVRTYGCKLPLYGTKTTSANEGDNNGLMWNDMRNQLPCAALLSYLHRVLNIHARNMKLAKEAMDSMVITRYAAGLFDKEGGEVVDLKVQLESSDGRCLVWNARYPNRTYRVNVYAGSCSRCGVRYHVRIPCRHLLAAAAHLDRLEYENLPDFAAQFPWCYTVENYKNGALSFNIFVPSIEELDFDNSIFAAALYTTSGRKKGPLQGKKRGRKPKRRHASTGEVSGGKVSKRRRVSSQSSQRVSPSPHLEGDEDDDDSEDSVAEEEDEDFVTESEWHRHTIVSSGAQLQEAVDAMTRPFLPPPGKGRREYRCSLCGGPHSRRRCPNPGGLPQESKDYPIVGGRYVVGNDPLEVLGLPSIGDNEECETEDSTGVPDDTTTQDESSDMLSAPLPADFSYEYSNSLDNESDNESDNEDDGVTSDVTSANAVGCFGCYLYLYRS